MSGKTLKFSKGNIDWSKWDKTKDLNPVQVFAHVRNCINNHNPDNIDPNCVCALLAEEFDGAEVTQPLLAGLSASECKDAFKFDQLANNFCNVDANNFKLRIHRSEVVKSHVGARYPHFPLLLKYMKANYTMKASRGIVQASPTQL